MIIAKSPLRVSFFGGGSDIPSHYMTHPGATVSMAIDSYVYVSVHRTAQKHIRLSYSKQEQVTNRDALQNDIVRACLRLFNITSNIEINSFSDMPTVGTGLGGSSAFTCALLAALAAYTQASDWDPNNLNPHKIAEMACDIELGACGWKIGKQDQYASAFGGMNYICYSADGIRVQKMDPRQLYKHMVLIPTGLRGGTAGGVLEKTDIAGESDRLALFTDMARRAAHKGADYKYYGHTLNQAWQEKREMSGVTNERVDSIIDQAIVNGALGCKLLGAGGGGYVLAIAAHRNALGIAARNLDPITDIRCSHTGTRIVKVDE